MICISVSPESRTLAKVDLLNAAIALVYNMTMVTHNVADYSIIPGLIIDDWLTR